jgi:hypothetical protein
LRPDGHLPKEAAVATAIAAAVAAEGLGIRIAEFCPQMPTIGSKSSQLELAFADILVLSFS